MSGAEAAGWHCGNCWGLNTDQDTGCVSCGVPRPVEEFVARPLLGARKGIGLQILGVMIAVTGLIVWGALFSAASYRGPGPYGTSWSNFVNWLQSSEGQLCLTILPLAAVLILLASVASIQNKRLDARRAAATPKDIHVPPRPEEREDERK